MEATEHYSNPRKAWLEILFNAGSEGVLNELKSRRDGRKGGGIQPSLRDFWAVRRPGFPALKRWAIITKSHRDRKMPKPTREQPLPRERLGPAHK